MLTSGWVGTLNEKLLRSRSCVVSVPPPSDCVDQLQLPAHDRIDRAGKAVGRRDLEQVGGLGRPIGGDIAEDALRRFLREHRAVQHRRAGHVNLLVVAEEEQAVLDDRAAEIEAELVLANARLGDAARVVHRRVGVELVVLDLVEGLASGTRWCRAW